jgi:ParB/RepB/Spo0J family partition protein
MTKEEFLKVDDEAKIEYLLTLDINDQKELLAFLKTKQKTTFFKISGKLKSRKSNVKSEKVSHAILDVNSVVLIDPKKIDDNPYQPRFPLEQHKLEELAASLKKGLLQPIVINQSSEDTFEVIAGHSRRDATIFNKEAKIKCIIYSKLSINAPEYKSMMLRNAVVENIHRNDLDPIETAISFKNALDEGLYKNQAELASAIDKQKIYVTKILSILKLCENVLNDLRLNKSIKDVQALYYIQKINDIKIQEKKYFELVDRKINRVDIVNYVQSLSINSNTAKKQNKIIKISNNKVTLNSDFSKLSKDKKIELEKELEEVIKRYC